MIQKNVNLGKNTEGNWNYLDFSLDRYVAKSCFTIF